MRKILLILAILGVLFFSGCIQMTTNYKINRDLTVDEQVVMKSSLFGMGNASRDPCASAEMSNLEMKTKCADVQCTFDKENGVLTVSGYKCDVSDAKTIKISKESGFLDTKYKAVFYLSDPSKLAGTNASALGGDASKLNISSKQTVEMLKSSGFSALVNITMPGKIVSTNYGNISKDGSSVVVDLVSAAVDENKPDKIEIVSQESTICPSLFILLGLLGIAFITTRVK